jgi:hypothetical protein
MANEGPLSYFFADAPAGSPQSYQSLLARRKIAEVLLGKRSPFPKTIGEGLSYLGESIANRRMLDALDEAEAGQAERDRTVLKDLPRGEGVSYSAPGTPSTAETYTRPSVVPQSEAPLDINRPPLSILPPGLPPAGAVITNPDDAGGIFGKNTRILGGETGTPSPVPPFDPDVGRSRIAAAMIPSPSLPIANDVSPDNRAIITDIQPAPAKRLTLPSQEPIPAPVEMSPPGAEPRPPDLLGPSQTMLYRDSLINSGRYSPHVIEALKQENLREELQRKDIQTKQQADYEFKRGRHYKSVDEYDKWIREGKLDEYVKRVGAEKAQSDLEEAYYKRGIPREQARMQADIDIQKGRRAVNKPNTFMAEGTQYEQSIDPRTGLPSSSYVVSPGAPAPEKKAPTETAAKAIQFVLRSQRDLDAMDRDMDYGKALTSRVDNAKHMIGQMLPGTTGAGLPSVAYRNAHDAFGNWGAAFLNLTSGSTVTPSEARTQLPAFMPVPGDDDARLRVKAQRRRDEMEAVKAGGGEITREAILASNARYMALDRAADQSGKGGPVEGQEQTNTATGQRRKFINGQWELIK